MKQAAVSSKNTCTTGQSSTAFLIVLKNNISIEQEDNGARADFSFCDTASRPRRIICARFSPCDTFRT
jgi:hypothetical protein